MRLGEMSFAQINSLDRGSTAVLFTVSPLEEHGPHLPVGTDVFTAEFFNLELARRILRSKPDWTVLIGPTVSLGASVFDAPGTLRARPRTVRNLALDYGAALARHDFRTILVTNGHAGPLHVVALEEAAAVVSRRYGVRMLAVSGPVLWKFLRGRYQDRVEPLLGRPLTPEERQALAGDAHAGLWETSLMLLIRPDLVDGAYATLPRVTFTLQQAARSNYPLRLGNQMGYIGAPAAARVEFGELAGKMLGEAAWEVARPVFEASDDAWQQTSFLYKIPFLRTGFPYALGAFGLILLGWALERLISWL
jgi:creatinine amidohydrolase